MVARHHRLAEGCRAAVAGWGLETLCKNPRWKSDSLTVIEVPKGIDSNLIVKNAYAKYDLSIGIGLAQVNGKVRGEGGGGCAEGKVGGGREEGQGGVFGEGRLSFADSLSHFCPLSSCSGLPHRAPGQHERADARGSAQRRGDGDD